MTACRKGGSRTALTGDSRMEAGKEIELRSEEVQEVMGQIPAWIVRWGITILFIVVLVLLVGSYFF